MGSDGPSHGPKVPGRTSYREIVVERGDDGLWRAVGENRCERWNE